MNYKGYKIEVANDEGPENPFEAWDCEPPLITYYGGRHGYAKSYQGAPETIGDVVRLMPASCFERGQRVALIRDNLNCSLREFVEEMRRTGDGAKETFVQFASDQVGSKPEGWRDAIAWFEMAEGLLKTAGIPCLNTESNGYCQGDTTLVLCLLTPDWRCDKAHAAAIMQSAVDLYSAWAWGDVYGVSAIYAPNPDDEDEHGDELPDGSCWGFYGSDHEKSGLMEHARSIIDGHIASQHETALNATACLI